jgi:hypothetical protein
MDWGEELRGSHPSEAVVAASAQEHGNDAAAVDKNFLYFLLTLALFAARTSSGMVWQFLQDGFMRFL